MSKVNLQIEDLDADILAITGAKLQEFNNRVQAIVKERDKYASIVQRHLVRMAENLGIDPAQYDLDLGNRIFVQKVQPDPVIPAETPPLET